MNFTSIATTLLRGNLSYALGRFYFVRLLYSFLRKHTRLHADLLAVSYDTLFPGISIEKSVNELQENAVTFGFNLPIHIVNEIKKFASEEKCFSGGDRKEFFFSEVKSGKLLDGDAVVLGFLKDPMCCPAVKKISADPVLLSVCARYLGYRPTSIETRLFWSFVTDEPDSVRRKKWQTTGYHFDVDGFNFIYANLYITPVTRHSGAHVMMQSSHRRKPLRMLFHSAVQPDESILKYYGQNNEITIEGPAGCGFIQDSSCYHKALAPISENRLMLQLRIK